MRVYYYCTYFHIIALTLSMNGKNKNKKTLLPYNIIGECKILFISKDYLMHNTLYDEAPNHPRK